VTDDGELILCLLWGLSRNKKKLGHLEVNLSYIAEYYRDWVLSEPFDIGFTTKEAFTPLTRPENYQFLVAAAKQSAFDKN